MNDDKLERISALMDGELDSNERNMAFETIEVDSEAKRCWQRYHIIGDTMRNTMPSTVKPDLAAKLNKMLENEPTILAPKFKPRYKKQLIPPAFVKPLAGLAVAASVTAVAIIGLQDNAQELPVARPGVAAVVINGSQISLIDANIDFAPMTEFSAASMVPSSTVRTVKYDATENNIHEEGRLNPYILNHNQVNSRMGVQGVSPNARLVGHGAGQ